jgi:hypothetical protein
MEALEGRPPRIVAVESSEKRTDSTPRQIANDCQCREDCHQGPTQTIVIHNRLRRFFQRGLQPEPLLGSRARVQAALANRGPTVEKPL